jgi:hypothetical protein
MNRAVSFAAAIATVAALGTGSGVWAASSAAAAPHGMIAKCTTSDVAVWLNLSESHTAKGSIYLPLEFTNISHDTCYLYAYPGVSAIDANGRQLGDAAVRSGRRAGRIVNVVPGATAHATLRYVDSVTMARGCKPERANYLKVYPEGQMTAGYTFFPVPSCTATGKKWAYLTIGSVQRGV